MSSTNEKNIHKVRFERLQLVGKKAVEQVLKTSLTTDQIKSCYKEIAESEVGLKSLETGSNQLEKYLLEETLAEFDHIYEENDLSSKLNDLDEVIQNAFQREQGKMSSAESLPVHIDQLSSSEIIDSMILNKKEDTLLALEKVYLKTYSDNEELEEKLRKIIANASAINSQIQDVLIPIKEQASFVTSDPVKMDSIIDLKEKFT
ncbi:hypothetical protein KGF56_003206 [Candida oxycetoniae]|uniref:Uncharacterized protein n=1 Tax=Candida oxycetoniae TaxID=497107 RepID=A0AAI9WXA5_9ASCO|nr:uncharacterized protein KGF56_003206 [Candida oxycetoniae]KAI3404047.2 hypothetical protein KGF56_003206 [Candida oxycetoniae]